MSTGRMNRAAARRVRPGSPRVTGRTGRWGAALCLLAVATGGLVPGAVAEECAYVTNADGATISIINTAAHRLVAHALVPAATARISDLALTTDGSHLYVLGSGVVSVVDTMARVVVAAVSVEERLNSVAVSPTGEWLYIGGGREFLEVIDGATLHVVATLPAATTGGFAFSPDGSLLYLTRAGGLLVLDVRTNVFVSDIGVDHAPFNVAIAPDGMLGYVTSGVLSVVDVSRNVDVNRNNVVATLRGLSGHLALNADGSLLYVAGTRSLDRLAVVDTRTNAIVAEIPVPAASHLDIALTQDGAFTYRATQSEVSVIDNAQQAVVTTVVLPPCATECGGSASIVIGEVPGGCPLTLLTPMPTLTPTPTPCAGDCDGDGQITVGELMRGVVMALGDSAAVCPAFDGNADGQITVSELLAAVKNALGGCGPR